MTLKSWCFGALLLVFWYVCDIMFIHWKPMEIAMSLNDETLKQRILYQRDLRNKIRKQHSLDEIVQLYKDVHQVMEAVETFTQMPVGTAVKDYGIALRRVVSDLDIDTSTQLNLWVMEHSTDPLCDSDSDESARLH
jgi:hypothetical protein